MRLRPTTAFWTVAAILGALLFASSVPSPLYPVYQAQWGFSAITLTSVFAVYAIALLAALLIVGSISDHIGRRPTVLGALAVEIVAMLAFAGADGVGWLFAARALQGAATGTAIAALSATLIDLQPSSKPWLGGLMGAVGPMTGLVFWLLVATFAAAALAVLAIPETVRRDGAWRGSLRPQVAVPNPMRAAFIAAIPSLAATWALGGLILSLGASLTAGVLGASSHLVAGLPIFVMAGISSLASIWLREVHPRVTAQRGLVAVIAGIAIALAALAAESEPLFLVGAAVAGVGFGPAFAGVFRTLSEAAPSDQRAGLISAVFIVSYLAFSIPAVIAGAAVSEIGLRDTAEIYGAVLIGVAVLALALSGNLARPEAERAEAAV